MGQGIFVMELEGGFETWKENDLPIEKAKGSRTKSAHREPLAV